MSVIQDPTVKNPTVEREYSGVDNDQEFVEIEAPDIQPPSFENIDHNEPVDIPGSDTEQPNFTEYEEPKSSSNPHLADADKKTRKKAAEHMADSILAAYDMLNKLGYDYAAFNEEKLQVKSLKGDFDMNVLNVPLPLSESDPATTITVKEFLDSINESLTETFTVDDDFKEAARPLLIEILSKKGWGMTPEQQLLFLFIEDAGPKIAGMISIKNHCKYILDLGMKMYEKQGKQNSQNNQFSQNQQDVSTVSQDDDLDPKPRKKRGRPPKSEAKSSSEKTIDMLMDADNQINLDEPEEN